MGDNVYGHNINLSISQCQIALGTPELWPLNWWKIVRPTVSGLLSFNPILFKLAENVYGQNISRYKFDFKPNRIQQLLFSFHI